MSWRRLSLGIVILLVAEAALRADVAKKPDSKVAPGEKEIRQAVTRSLGFLEKEGLAWWKVRKCNGCHHGNFLLWTHHEAERQGIAVRWKD